MKSAELHRHLRPAIKAWAKAAGFRRLASSPPSYSREDTDGHVTLWFMAAAGGWDRCLGHQFTGTLQWATAPLPGIDISMDDPRLTTARLPTLWTTGERATALEIHNRAIAKLARPATDHWIWDLAHAGEAYVSGLLSPRPDPPTPNEDYWMRFYDVEDVEAWANHIQRSLDGMIGRFLGRPHVASSEG